VYNVTRTFHVPVGHRLSMHKGLCKNIHGHNLKIQVSIRCFELNDNGMVIDFSDLKEIVNNYLEAWDHSLLLNSRDDLANYAQKNSKTFFTAGDPTAENLCKYLFARISGELGIIQKTLTVNFIRIWENDDSYAEYNGEE
jgi:6-pyruvoyltetrahydropterin/6-carboxytetrahydropterin synthase